jgi:O-antigen/teichoic acid export membrane protein
VLHRVTANLGLQALNLLGKALLLFLLARYLSVADVGLFGLVFSTLTLALVFVGLGYNLYSIREMLRGGPDRVPRLLRDQVVLHGLTYVPAVPVLLGVFAWRVLPWSLAGWFISLLVLEHLNTELYQVLIALTRTTRATALLFLRHGAWVYGLLALVLLAPGRASLPAVLGGWACGEAAALLLGAFWLRDLPWRAALVAPVDWPWLGRGLWTTLPLLLALLATSGANMADRYALEALRGPEDLGVYTFYGNVRTAILSLLEIGIFNLVEPRIVAAYQRGQLDEYRRLMRNLLGGLLGLGALLTAAAVLLIRPVVALVGKPVYGEHLDTFGLVLVLTVVHAVMNLPLLALYARRMDWRRLLVSLLGLAAAVALNLLLVPSLGMNGAALATIGAFALIALASLGFVRRGGG